MSVPPRVFRIFVGGVGSGAACPWIMVTHNTLGVHGIQGDEWDSALNDCFYFVDIIMQ